jgi:6-pyruvoyltetrahydropterin/6-carboxytetrahydropterin synthase
MGTNFHVLKAALKEFVHERFDHRHLNDLPPFDDVPPTTENLAKETFRILKNSFEAGASGKLAKVEVWEGPESCVAYEE